MTTLPASDIGVTAAELRVGVILPDLGSLGRFGFTGFADPKKTQAFWQAFVDEVNDRGGVGGRRILPFFRAVDIVSASDRRAACLEMTEQHEVFAVLSDLALQQEDLLCVTEEHGRPFFAGGDVDDDTFARSRGLLFSHDAGRTRTWANAAWLADGEKSLRSRKLGIVSDETSGPSVEAGLIPTLESLGYKVVDHQRLPFDPGAAQSQMPLAVSQMRSKGVDTVFLTINPINGSTFIQHADGQQWSPQWIVSDNSAYTHDTSGSLQPSSFDGAWAVTGRRTGSFRVGEPEAPFDGTCMEVAGRRMGQRPDVTKRPEDFQDYFNAVRACALVELFVQGARRAGPNLTAATWGQRVQELGPVPLGFAPDGSFAPGKLAAGGDLVRLVGWRRSCGENGCWVPDGSWVPARF